jgi:hypothetical protein
MMMVLESKVSDTETVIEGDMKMVRYGLEDGRQLMWFGTVDEEPDSAKEIIECGMLMQTEGQA